MEKTDLATLVNSCLLSHNDFLPICSDVYVFSEKPHPQKKQILQHLKSFNFSWVSSQCVIDKKNDQVLDTPEKLYNDKKYEWSETDIYHFEKYDLILDSEFISHIIN